jgi:hypothetical protein
MPTSSSSPLPALLIAGGLALGGLLVGSGLVDSKRADRFVTVKGVAEQEVEADLAFWAITVSTPADRLEAAQAEVDDHVSRVLRFLSEFGLDSAQVSRQGTQVQDRAAQYVGASEERGPRFVVSHTLMVRSADVAAVHSASQAAGRLLAEGVPLTAERGWGYSRPTYAFTGLSDIKPAMITLATENARRAAQRFADDSGGRLDGIRRANQGVFQILPFDGTPGMSESEQRRKTVRVVATLEYYLTG